MANADDRHDLMGEMTTVRGRAGPTEEGALPSTVPAMYFRYYETAILK